MGESRGLLRMVVPSATVFFSSCCIMILELVASRLVTGALGSSLYSWTSIIGVVLAGISIGGYCGGRIADRYHARRALAVLFGLASAACVGIIVANNLVGGWTWLWRLNWPSHVILHVTLVFLVPSMLLGMIAPVVAKMALDQGLATGRTIGSIYAWGAAGSIAGIFLAGFFLIATLGSTTIIWGIGAAMLVMAILYWVSCWAMHLWAMVFAALLTVGMSPADWAREAGITARLREPLDPNVLYEDETPYCHVAVRQLSERPDRRALWQDQLLHSEIVLDDVTNLQRFYLEVYAALTHGLAPRGGDLSAMVIGGGGYAWPRYIEAHWPRSRVEVVEIDPGVTQAAARALGLTASPSITTVNFDARSYVDRLLEQHRRGGELRPYDLIYGDAAADYSVPFHLVTREFNERIHRLLTDDGVYMVNLTDTRENGKLLGAVYSTLRETFEQVYVVTGRGNVPSSLRNTFVVVAAKRGLDIPSLVRSHHRHLRFRVFDAAEIASIQAKSGRIVLTDDFAPVENLLAPVVRQGAGERLARRYLRRAEQLQRQEQFEQSIAAYREAARLDPSLSMEVHSKIAAMRLLQGDHSGAAEALREAIRSHAAADTGDPAIATVHHRLGVLLKQTGKPQEAKQHLAQAAEWAKIELETNPRSFVVWDRLGETLATMGDFKGASEAFERAASFDSSNPTHYQKLARALELQQRYGEAAAAVRKQIALLQKRGQRDQLSQLRHYMELLEYQHVKQSR